MPEALWTFAEALDACGGATSGPAAPDLTSVSIDSRTLEPGALFVAIRGENQDGHAYVAQAFDKEAGAAMVAADATIVAPGPLVRVADTLKGLEALGRAARARMSGQVIAVTGSVGKTGTKEALRLALSPSGATHASRKSYNNQWGVPLSLAGMPRDTRYGVFEIGMNHPGEITPLTHLVRPHAAIVTTVEAVHLGFFSSVEEIAEAKAEIFQGLEPGGTAVINCDNPHFDLLETRALAAGAGSVLGFGKSVKAGARLLSAKLDADGSSVKADIAGSEVRYRLGAAGEHLVMNSLAVLAVVQAVGADLEAAARSLEGLRAAAGRGERSVFEAPDGRIVLIDEAYNANPASMRAALAAMRHVSPGRRGRRIAVLGDMLELGLSGPDLHRALSGPVEAAGIDVVFACGPQMACLYEALPESRRGGYAHSSDELQSGLLKAVRPGDVVMVKGSLGSRMGPLVEALKAHLSASGPAAGG